MTPQAAPSRLEPVTTTLRERVAAAPWRRRIAARRSLDHVYRVGVGAVGGVIVAVGLVTVPLPGPGWLTVIAGLLVLASEFAWAERRLASTRRHVARWGHWLARQARAVRVAVAVATAASTCAVAVVTLHVVGVPTWVPDAVPLWR